jgi:hypothetical protein
VEAIIKQCRAQGVAPWVKQFGKLPSDKGELLPIFGQNGKRSGHAEDWDRWPERLAHLKVRELPAVDPDLIAMGINESELGRIENKLGQLAEGLEPEEAGKELELREKYIGAERRLFMSRQERGSILAAYKDLYGPLRKWSEFLRIVDLPRQTAYDLLAVAREADSTVSVQSPRAARSAKTFGLEEAVDKAAGAVQRTLGRLPEKDRQAALNRLVERLGSLYVDETAEERRAA